MVVHRNKDFEQNSLFPNINYTSDLNAYVVDETTESGKKLTDKITKLFPYYDFVITDGILVDVTEIAKPEFSNAGQINDTVVQRIRQVYSQDDEFKMLNKGIVDNQDADFLQYRTYVQECKDWGTAKKQELGF